MGRIDDGLAMAEDPSVILTAFGDMMRVPGTKGSLLDYKARGCDVRIVYSPLDALRLAQDNPDRHVVFFAIGFETTAPSTALTLQARQGAGRAQLRVFCNHVTIIPAIRAILDSPDMRIDAFIGPGHVSTVIGCRPYEWIAQRRGQADRRGRVRAARPAAVDRACCCGSSREGRARGREPVQPRRAVGGQPRGARGDGRRVRAAAVLRVARHGLHLAVGAAAQRRATPHGMPSGGSRCRASSVTDPKAAQCGEVLKGVLRPRDCKLFGKECTPEQPVGALMVSSEGSCAAYYNYVHRKTRSGGAMGVSVRQASA